MENLILIVFVAYTLLLFFVAHLTSRKSSNNTFFTGNRKSPWFVVAYGMIGASLSGVTFMSVPGGVYSGQFTYFGIVLGYIIGYAVIALLLLPLYYKLNLTSIYSYLEIKFGKSSEKTGALLFIISRLIGSAIRMYLVVFVLYEFVGNSILGASSLIHSVNFILHFQRRNQDCSLDRYFANHILAFSSSYDSRCHIKDIEYFFR